MLSPYKNDQKVTVFISVQHDANSPAKSSSDNCSGKVHTQCLWGNWGPVFNIDNFKNKLLTYW